MLKKCCANCFTDPWLQEEIRTRSTSTGTCGYCRSEGMPLLAPYKLEAEFANAIQSYSPLRDGQNYFPHEDILSIGEYPGVLLEEDFGIFNQNFGDRVTSELLEAILEDDESFDPKTLYTRRDDLPFDEPELEDQWQMFCEVIRKDPSADWDADQIAKWVSRLSICLPCGSILSRARPGFQCVEGRVSPWSGAGIGAPPPEGRKPGRLSRQGQPILYCADKEATAIAEVRAGRGDLVSVCHAKTSQDLRLIDLSRPIGWPNPFLDDNLRYNMQIPAILTTFSEQLGRPLARTDDIEHYVPCQYLSDRIRSNFDGIRYRSSLSIGGENVAIFNPANMEILESWLVVSEI